MHKTENIKNNILAQHITFQSISYIMKRILFTTLTTVLLLAVSSQAIAKNADATSISDVQGSDKNTDKNEKKVSEAVSINIATHQVSIILQMHLICTYGQQPIFKSTIAERWPTAIP